MNSVVETGLAVAVGTGSALLPLINAEAYVLVAVARTHPALTLVVVVSVAAGQTLGKLLFFEASRRGSARLHARLPGRDGGGAARWSARVNCWLTRRRTGLPTVAVSAVVGLPPLALVSIAAGAAGQRRCEFAALCLLGRTARFAALALPLVYALG